MRIILNMTLYKIKDEFMKRLISIVLFAAISLGVVSCSRENTTSNKYVASFYPLEYIMQRLNGSDKNIINITPIGAEPHDLELSPDKVIDVEDSKFVLAMGNGFAPSVDNVAKKNKNSILILSKLDETKNSDDPHFWLDPVLMKEAANIVYLKLIKLNPERDVEISKNYERLIEDLDNLDVLYKNNLSACESKTFITSHDAFGYLAKRYGIKQESIAGFSPENEPSGARLSQLSKLAKSENVKVIFSEDLVSDKLSKALAKEVGIKTETLNAIEFLTDKNIKNGDDYISLMAENLLKFKSALACP